MKNLVDVFKEKLSPEAYYSVGYDSGVIIYFPSVQNKYKNGSELLGINLALEYAMNVYNADNAQIICFGNNLYGKEITNIWSDHSNVHIDLLVCSPNAEIIEDSDKEILRDKIKLAEENNNTTVYASQLPPTLRSCVLYKDKEPVLCCIQYYVLSDSKRKPKFMGRDTPCIIAYYNGEIFPLKQYVKFCEAEFLRLQGNILD